MDPAFLIGVVLAFGALVAMITMLRLVPMGLFGAFLGAFAERFDRRLTLAGIVGLMTVTSALLSVVAFGGALEVWHLAVAAFINGCGWATDNPLRRVMMGEVMGRDRMAIAMALDVGAGNVSRMVGPAVGGLLLAGVGMATAAPAFTGIAVIIALLLVMTGSRHGRLILLPVLAPVLAAWGLLPLYAIAAGSTRSVASRIWTSVAGMLAVLAWQIVAGASSFMFTGGEQWGIWDRLKGLRSPMAAGDLLLRPLGAHPQALMAAGIMIAAALTWPLVLRSRGTTRISTAVLWGAGVTIAAGLLGGGGLWAVGAVIPSAILAIAWAARPWRVRHRGRAEARSASAADRTETPR